MTLSEIPAGTRAKILRLNESGAMRRRLLDMGFTRGAAAECALTSPSGDPRAYWVRGALIALRRENAEKIVVE